MSNTVSLAERTADLLREFGLEPDFLGGAGEPMPCVSPIDGSALPSVGSHTEAEVAETLAAAAAAFEEWRLTPAPVRGGWWQRLGELLREHKAALARAGHDRGGQDTLGGPSARCRR